MPLCDGKTFGSCLSVMKVMENNKTFNRTAFKILNNSTNVPSPIWKVTLFQRYP